ncbi:MAG TPA: hypothetical protein VI300_26440 [Solirubrobacter sp.]
MQIIDNVPCELFPTWRRAQLAVERHARHAPPPAAVLRTTGFLRPELAESVTEWFLQDAPLTDAVLHAYGALERETAGLFEIARRDLGVSVRYADGADEPYDSAAELCAELRERGSMTLACDERHPLLGRAYDELRVVHDVFGHAALGLGFDLQSEFATWLQCRTLFSADARPAAFCELVGAVTAYITTGEKPGLRAKLPPAALLTACG